MTEDVIQLLTPEGHLIEHPDYPLDVDAGLLRTLYRDIMLTRRTDVESTALQRTGELGCGARCWVRRACKSARATP